MKNKILDCGETLPYSAGVAVTSGQPILIGVTLGVAVAAYASTDEGMYDIEGVFVLDKATSQAHAVGAKVYWDDSAKKITTTSSGNTLCGIVWKAALSADTSGSYKLIPNS